MSAWPDGGWPSGAWPDQGWPGWPGLVGRVALHLVTRATSLALWARGVGLTLLERATGLHLWDDDGR